MLPSVFDVSGFAASTVATATASMARYVAVRENAPARPVSVDERAASAAFRCEALFTPIGWERPPIWDPIAGDYAAADGWIRLHTNYAYHRAAVEQVLGAVRERDEVAAAVGGWSGAELESAVVAAGGCAAMMYGRADWLATPAGAAVANEPPVRIERHPALALTRPASFDVLRPLAGVRVLDLTRVIAGPVATRFLGAYGADVLRVDPPGFQEVGALLPETTAGKRCTALDLRTIADRTRFEALLGAADVLVCGLRGDALDALGLSADRMQALNPALIDARLDAYGWSGPWQHRRGFDSLVQMSCGIAAAGAAAAGTERPHPLPAQALDHGTGYLVAAAVIDALTHRFVTGEPSALACSLAATATELMRRPGELDTPAPQWTDEDTAPVRTAWGDARAVPVPGRIEGIPSALTTEAGPLGRHDAGWLPK